MAERNVTGVAVEFSDQGAQVVDHLVAETKKVSDENAALKVQLTDSAKGKEKLQGEFDALKAAQLTDAQIEVKTTERLDVIDQARKLHPKIETSGKSLDAIKRDAIEHADTGKVIVLDDKTTADYVDGVFKAFVAKAPDASKQSLHDATQHADSGAGNPADPAGDARRAFEDHSANAWKFDQVDQGGKA